MTHPAMAKTVRRKTTRKCRMCRKLYTPSAEGQEVCAWECGLQLVREREIKTLKRKRLDEAKIHKARKVALKTTSEWVQEAESEVRRYCRIRDAADPCISCGISVAEVESGGYKPGGHWDGGHFLAKGARPELRFSTWNIHKQCKSCNGGSDHFTSKGVSVQAGYEARLIEKIGADRVIWLKGQHPVLQPKIDYLQRMKRIFAKRARHIKKLRGQE